MNRTMLFASAGIAGMLAATPALAQEMSAEDVARLAERVEALEAETAALRAELEAARAETAAPEIQTTPSIEMKPTPEVEADGFTFKPRGRLQYDVANVSAPDAIQSSDDGLGLGQTLRRARLGVSGDMPGGFGYKFEVDFADNEVNMTDAIITYEDGPLGITVGQHNSFWGLEEMTSSNHISFIERAAFTDAFGFIRRVGVSASYEAGDVAVWGGFFTANLEDWASDEEDQYGFDGRIVWMPTFGDTQLHFGANAHYIDLDDDNQSVRFRQRPNIATTDTRFINTDAIPASETLSYGLETALVRGPLHVAAETHWKTVSALAGLEDPTFFGGYAEVGYFLTPGDSRAYGGGDFGRIRPVRPVGEGGWGALQANLRYDRMDLTDGAIVGGTQDAFGGSLIWTPMDYIRFMAQYQRLEIDDAAIAADGDTDYGVDVVAARAQVEF